MDTKIIGSGLVGFILGILLTGVFAWNAAPGMMMMEDETRYGFEESVDRFTQAVKDQGWKMPAVHDLQKTMKKFDKDVKSVKVFELCHPEHAGKILAKDDERIVTSLMPCRVAIYEHSDGTVYASRMNSGLLGKMMDGIVPEVMADASADSEEILKSIL
ncbi:MAG: DUF302 domain-containing protein [Candidatus Marinimicrobia bacterium]|nr:DUF302 domain-containing protein [Candidatus Neomarinimicrobiota bacterium]